MAFIFERCDMKTLQELGQEVRKARESRGLTLAELAAETGISKPYLSNIENATTTSPPSTEKLSRLAHALGMDEPALQQAADWLRTPASIRQLMSGGAAAPPRRADGTLNLDALLKTSAAGAAKMPTDPAKGQSLKITPIPLINRIPAGKPVDYTNLEYPLGVADRYVPSVVDETGSEATTAVIALRVTGDSMEPEYKDGDIVQFANATARDGDDCLVRLGELENFEQTFKRVYFVTQPSENGELQLLAVRLVPLNTKYPQREIRIEEVSGIFPAIWKMSPTRRTALKPL